MQRLIYVIATVLIVAGVILLCFSHEGFKYHVHETLVGLGPFQLLGADSEVTAAFSPLYGSLSLGIGVIMLVVTRLAGRDR